MKGMCSMWSSNQSTIMTGITKDNNNNNIVNNNSNNNEYCVCKILMMACLQMRRGEINPHIKYVHLTYCIISSLSGKSNIKLTIIIIIETSVSAKHI